MSLPREMTPEEKQSHADDALALAQLHSTVMWQRVLIAINGAARVEHGARKAVMVDMEAAQ